MPRFDFYHNDDRQRETKTQSESNINFNMDFKIFKKYICRIAL